MAGKNQKGPCPFSDYPHGLEVPPSIYTMTTASLQDPLYGGGADARDSQQLLLGSRVDVDGKSVQVPNGDGRLGVGFQWQKAAIVESQL